MSSLLNLDISNQSFKAGRSVLVATDKKLRNYCSFLVLKKARSPKYMRRLMRKSELTDECMEQIFPSFRSVAFQLYVKAFQYNVLNCIPYTNSKLRKIGLINEDLSSFCKELLETPRYLIYG